MLVVQLKDNQVHGQNGLVTSVLLNYPHRCAKERGTHPWSSRRSCSGGITRQKLQVGAKNLSQSPVSWENRDIWLPSWHQHSKDQEVSVKWRKPQTNPQSSEVHHVRVTVAPEDPASCWRDHYNTRLRHFSRQIEVSKVTPALFYRKTLSRTSGFVHGGKVGQPEDEANTQEVLHFGKLQQTHEFKLWTDCKQPDRSDIQVNREPNKPKEKNY